ncbi:MAG: ABC transporter ATP-binding protein [SAR324 cluster bacterium]|uniref:ABC transporter ATP-binding protein n=1 Tax=SAR324 cluster bacterium TaxID=2024889 RepID=A0A7X9FTJ3_9DELT|nr:ABC transporter ATP-binding protein [SAR324 cluster bacterium]
MASENAPQYAIDIKNLSKDFHRQTLGKGGYTTLKSSLLNIFRSDRDANAHFTHAIKDLTMRIPQGLSVGVIGKNGSGKSTLLKLITGIYSPSQGSVSVNGRMAALIELGAGFHPDFSGRENLYLGGVMHGLSRKEIDERFDKIVRFAELEEFIDDPVRTYSSGMFMRLGFSLAVHTDPDILLVDEVLAVGDAAFVGKCKEKIAQLKKEGKTLLLVTHDLDAVRMWCDEALWLHEGEVKDRGEPKRVIDHYREFIERGEEILLRESQSERDGNQSDLSIKECLRWGSREIEILSARIVDKNGEPRLMFHPDDDLKIEIDYQMHQRVDDVVFGIGIVRSDGLVIHGSNTNIEGLKIPLLNSEGTVSYDIKRLGLLDGNYSLDVAVHSKDEYPYDYHKSILTFAVRWPQKQVGVIVPEHCWKF